MSLFQEIQDYKPFNEQEAADKAVMLQYMKEHDNYLERENLIAHFSTSIWTVNKERDKTLLVYHNIFNSWSWIGGHADGVEDLRSVALRELQEETGVANATMIRPEIFSLEIIVVDGHIKKGLYVPSHLHLNVTYLAEADEKNALTVKQDENQAVQWWPMEEILTVSKEPWMVERVYKKLIEKCRQTV